MGHSIFSSAFKVNIESLMFKFLQFALILCAVPLFMAIRASQRQADGRLRQQQHLLQEQKQAEQQFDIEAPPFTQQELQRQQQAALLGRSEQVICLCDHCYPASYSTTPPNFLSIRQCKTVSRQTCTAHLARHGSGPFPPPHYQVYSAMNDNQLPC